MDGISYMIVNTFIPRAFQSITITVCFGKIGMIMMNLKADFLFLLWHCVKELKYTNIYRRIRQVIIKSSNYQVKCRQEAGCQTH